MISLPPFIHINQHRYSTLFFSVISLSLLPFYTDLANANDIKTCTEQKQSAILLNPPPEFEAGSRDITHISADSSHANKQGDSKFTGDVIIERHQLRINADTASHSTENKTINISGNVLVDTTGMSLSADSGTFSTENDITDFQNINFSLSDGMYGSAKTIKADSNKTSTLHNASITSCDPQDPDWLLDAENITLNHSDEYGTADDIILRFKNAPLLYLPYIEFPLGDRRRSGLLVPELSYSSQRGTEFKQPWYWNIAPNQDAILTPHFMNRRGLALDTRYRFLTDSSEGQLDASFLAHDQIADDKRYQLQYKQKTRFNQDLKLQVDVQDVSDTDYFIDFSNNLSSSSTTHLPRSAKLTHSSQDWKSSVELKSYETLDTTIASEKRPYRTLPKIILEGDQPLNDHGLSLTLDAEWVEFDHKDESRTTGSRLSFKPGLGWMFSGAAWYINPAIHFSHTQYGTKDADGNSLIPNDRNLSMSSIDAGLFFERELDNGLIQTLEPRLFYLNVPYKDQSQLPVFDSRLSTFNSAQLFLDNRFSGNDRIGDANQLTLALSSRFFTTDTGDERARLSLGQIVYFEDRLVSLNTSAEPEQNRASDYIGEFSANWNNWNLSGSVQWDREIHEASRQNFLLHYQSDHEHIFNLGLRTNKDANPVIRQTDISFVYPVNERYSIFSRWNYSLEENRDIDVIGGISYDSCCWSLQLLAQRHQINTTSTEIEYDNAFMLQLVLKGLGSVSGNKVRRVLHQAIQGYDEEL